MRIAFYSPMKPPDHPVPSGDRVMAGLLLAALSEAGYNATVVSKLRSFSKSPDLPGLRRDADAEIDRLLAMWDSHPAPQRPDIWFTYHPYYKAPDLIGPVVAGRLNIPYVTAEASYSSKRQTGEWKGMQSTVVDAVRQAAINFCMTPIDRAGLAQIADTARLADLPPFIDAATYASRHLTRQPGDRCRLVTVAMMRPGVKLDSYVMLSRALGLVRSDTWCLTVIGDGPQRAEVERLFAGLPADRVRFLGERTPGEVRDELCRSDVYVWPGFREAYGLAYLEAQACCVPVIAQNTAGVPSVVCQGRTGLLTPVDDVSAYAEAMDQLIVNDDLRTRLSKRAGDFVHEERTVAKAANVLDRGLRRAVEVFAEKTLVT